MRNLIRSAGAEVGSLIRDAGVEAGRTILGNELRQETRTGVVIGSGLAATGMGVASYAVHVLGRVIESIEQAASKSGGIDSTLIQTLARDKEMSPESVMTTLHALAS